MPWTKNDNSIREEYEKLLDVKLNPDVIEGDETVFSSFKVVKRKQK